MPRNLDTSLIRAFVAVAESRSMTVAAGTLHLTQAAVSQQIKRLEEGFACALFERDRRGLALTHEGERLFGKAKRLLGLNDEIWADMTTPAFRGEVKLGVPFDLVGPYLPPILKGFSTSYPQIEITLVCYSSPQLLAALEAGDVDIALAEELAGRSDGECLATERLVWVGAKGGDAYRRVPLPISFCDTCAFRPTVLHALGRADLAWRGVTEKGSTEAIWATVQTDLAVTALLASTVPAELDVLRAADGLPELPDFQINLHLPRSGPTPVTQALAQDIRNGFCGRLRQAA